jgi:hypothetical protein
MRGRSEAGAGKTALTFDPRERYWNHGADKKAFTDTHIPADQPPGSKNTRPTAPSLLRFRHKKKHCHENEQPPLCTTCKSGAMPTSKVRHGAQRNCLHRLVRLLLVYIRSLVSQQSETGSPLHQEHLQSGERGQHDTGLVRRSAPV